jgi:hypothetical protein
MLADPRRTARIVGRTAILVASSIDRPASRIGVVPAIAAAHGGLSASVGQLRSIADHLRSSRPRRAVRETARPMRSPWWIVAFAVCLSVEWLGRRQRGLR